MNFEKEKQYSQAYNQLEFDKQKGNKRYFKLKNTKINGEKVK